MPFVPGGQGLAIGLEGLNALLSASRGQSTEAGIRLIAIGGGVLIGKGLQALKANKSVGVVTKGDDAIPNGPVCPKEGTLIVKTDDVVDALAAKGSKVDSPPIHEGQQGKHIIGHNNYIPGRSILRADPEELRKFAGTGIPLRKTPVPDPGSRELIDFEKIIGDYVDPATGIATPTQWGIIIYSKTGIHIVPVRPQVPRP